MVDTQKDISLDEGSPQLRYYWRNREKVLARVNEYNKTHREQVNQYNKARREWNAEYIERIKAERGCSRCGIKDPDVLVFHHLDPSTKVDDLSRMRGWSVERIDAEIAKCEVLCHNCHFKLMHDQREAVNDVK
jgi:hypothetical protein